MLASSSAPSRAAAAHVMAARVALAQKNEEDAAIETRRGGRKSRSHVPMGTSSAAGCSTTRAKFDEAARVRSKTPSMSAQVRRRAGGSCTCILGRRLTQLDRIGDAEPEFRDELRAFPHNLQAYASLAMLYRASDRDAEVEDVLEELVESTSTPEGYAMAAQSCGRQLGERSRAEALRSDARARFRGDPSLVLART